MNARFFSAPCESSAQSGYMALLSGIWQRVLQVTDVEPDSNFFDLGGDSLLAISLLLTIERETGRKLPITAIYDAQTLAEQALLLEEEPAPEFSPLVLLKPGHSSAPLFIFHGVGGTVIEFAKLGKLIDISGEVYAVQAQGVDGTLPPLDSVEGMAELYYRAIREKQPTGPYWLCGYSFGGLLAVEVARLLKNAGEQIALLFLIDAYAHPITWPRKSRLKVRLRRAVNAFVSKLFSPRVTMQLLLARASADRQGRKATPATVEERRARKQQWLLHRNPDLPPALLQTRLTTETALYRYRPSYYNGDIVFLKAKVPDPDFPDDPKHVWRRLARKLTLHVSPGSHLTIVSDQAEPVAARINACIEEASWNLQRSGVD
jgi:thioesterase domain-containing protein/acyl carrier protein